MEGVWLDFATGCSTERFRFDEVVADVVGVPPAAGSGSGAVWLLETGKIVWVANPENIESWAFFSSWSDKSAPSFLRFFPPPEGVSPALEETGPERASFEDSSDPVRRALR